MIILISGKKRSGKDTAARLLQKYIPNSTIASFAGPLKEIVAKSFCISEDTLDELKNDEAVMIGFKSPSKTMCTRKTVRNFLQVFGTEAMKSVFGDEVWAKLMFDKYLSLPKGSVLIIPDFRVPEEYNYIAARTDDILTLEITRKGLESSDSHITENGLKDFKFDARIGNNSDLEELEVLMELLAQNIGFIE